MKKTQELKNFTYSGKSVSGSERENNEDRYDYIHTVNGDLFILCDGMGGVKGGEIAAEKAVEAIKHFVSNEWIENPKVLLKKAMFFANESIINETKKYAGINMMGTTAVVLLLRENNIYFAHAGDSRIYYKTGSKLFRLTNDHSYVQDLINKKIITEEEAKLHTRRNEITQALGIANILEPDIYSSAIKPADDDYILLCSDGLSSFVDNVEILEIINLDEKIKKKNNLLIKKATANDSDDNITVQLIHFYNTGRSKSKFNVKKTSSKKLKIIGVLSFLIFITGIYLFVKLFSENVDIKTGNIMFFERYTKANTLYSNKKDTVIIVYFKNNIDIEKELKKFNVLNSQVGYATALKSEYLYFAKFYIPVKNIRYVYPGENIFLLSTFYNISVEDIFIVNNKEELSLNPGEKIIIPKSEE